MMAKSQTMLEKTQTINSMVTQNRMQGGLPCYVLGINFIELIMKERTHLEQDKGYFYLSYRFLGQNYRTKFLVH